ncbi:DUF11 domain-containing protein [Hymenobacter cavernae]|uniref:DUF11 domain-containing protein n=1 Tax=Hymenobacter cavernae TaxID=2044852 RepID=A0ABQ1TLU0_9BACT|nr:DUF11 domain-containing protein [Hymenobacter cavernae]GGE98017.1 hypothetical protein GCM10011383_05990 [Hymenobacter cavernae]
MGDGEVQGTAASAAGAASGDLTAILPDNVTKLVITHRNTRPYAPSTNRIQTLGINSINWCAQADLYARFTGGPTNGATGQSLTYTVQFGNNGPNLAASNVTRQVVVPEGATITNAGGGTISGNTITFPLVETMSSGVNNSFTYTYTAPIIPSGDENTATISATTASGDSIANRRLNS